MYIPKKWVFCHYIIGGYHKTWFIGDAKWIFFEWKSMPNKNFTSQKSKVIWLKDKLIFNMKKHHAEICPYVNYLMHGDIYAYVNYLIEITQNLN